MSKSPEALAAITEAADYAIKGILKARAFLVVRHPFFGCLALILKLEESTRTETMAVDGESIFYNAEWVLGLTRRELSSVIAHEVLHVAFLHHLRRGNRGKVLWNEAADYAINGILVKSQLFDLPDGGLYDKKYVGWAAEKIYRELEDQGIDPKQPDQPGSEPGESNSEPGESNSASGEGGGEPGEGDASSRVNVHAGEVWDGTAENGEALTPSEIAEAERTIGVNVQIAAQAEKAIGQGSGSDVAGAVIKGRVQTPLPWHEILRDFLLETTVDDYSWSVPNRRFIGQGIYLPSLDATPVGELVFAVDCSCSLGQVELDTISGHLAEIVEAVNPTRSHVIYCDSTVRQVDTYELGEEVVLSEYGGGGTAFEPPFNWCLENDIRPSCLVYFTDGYGFVGRWSCLKEVPDYPVVWATTDAEPQFVDEPFGEVIEVE